MIHTWFNFVCFACFASSACLRTYLYVCKIFEDNRGCEKWTRTLPEPNRTKHIDIAYHHAHGWVKLGKITILPVAANLQLADALTKALPRPQHEFLLENTAGPR